MIFIFNNTKFFLIYSLTQITPAALIQMMEDLKVRKEISASQDFQNKLTALRSKIDITDSQILEILSKRMKISEEIGQVKKDQNVAILQTKRWNEILGKMVLEGEDKGLSEEFVLRLFKAIHQESINHQQKILDV